MISALRFTVAFLLNFTATIAMCQDHVELGKVGWLRDLDQAQAQAQKQGKPILMLFQEVPGCATCQNFGLKVLAHPLIVEAIETYFVPLAIFNNRGGDDAKVLKAYQEPTWNNPVVRFIDHRGKNLIQRHAGDYSAIGLLRQMMAVMDQKDIEVPGYMTLLVEELAVGEHQVAAATFGMFCFWTGEKTYGQLSGVLHTEAGFIEGREVVEVTYDPAQINFEELTRIGQEAKCADTYYYEDRQQELAATKLFGKQNLKKKGKYRADREIHYYLHHSRYAQIPMSPIQRTKANAMLGNRIDPVEVFSPRQLTFLNQEDTQKRYLSDHWAEMLMVNI